MNVDGMNLIFVDVEATGRTPMRGEMTEFGAVHFGTRETFHGVLWDSMPSPENPAIPVLTPGGQHYNEHDVMTAFSMWVAKFDGRPIFVSDNPGYDFMWIACAFDNLFSPFEVANPFGHSSRRIGDFYAGLVGNFRTSSAWKKYRVTPHTHNPVDDAMGNAEAFATLIEHGEDHD